VTVPFQFHPRALTHLERGSGEDGIWTGLDRRSTFVTVDERGGLRLIDYLRWVELHIYMTVHELSITCTRRSGQDPNRYNISNGTKK
jgi:hypothetical protein